MVIFNGRFLWIDAHILSVMYIYEVVYRTSDGEIDHQVVTDESEDAVRDGWETQRDGDDTIIAVDRHGRFRTNDIFEEIKADIVDRGVPDEYQ